METKKHLLRIDRREIGYLRFILEGYDGLAVLTTMDPRAGLVALHVPPGCESVVNMILKDLAKEMMIERVSSVRPEAGMERKPFEDA